MRCDSCDMTEELDRYGFHPFGGEYIPYSRHSIGTVSGCRY